MRLTLRGRVFASLAAVLVLVLVVGGLLAIAHFRRSLREAFDLALQARADVVAHLEGRGTKETRVSEADLEQYLRSPSLDMKEPLRGVIVYQRDSETSVSSQSLDEAAVAALVRAAVAAPPPGPSPLRFDLTLPSGAVVRVCGVPARSRRLLILAVGDPQEVGEEVDDLIAGLAVMLFVVLGVSTGVAWLAARWVDGPVRTIALDVIATESGRRPVVISAPGTGDELDALAQALQRAFRRLDETALRESRFAAHAAHELRTPLATMIAQAETTLRRPRGAEDLQASLSATLAAARRMNELVEALLELARGERPGGADASSDPGAVASAVADEFSGAAAAAQLNLRVDATEARTVAASVESVATILRNLVRNAIVHSGRPGDLIVAVAPDGAFARLSVSDRGVGLPTEHLAHVFEPLYRVDASRGRAVGGAGLGLAVVRAVAEAHGGRVAVTSILGEGTTFSVWLPARA